MKARDGQRNDLGRVAAIVCTPSDRHPGLCRIGGQLFAGNVNVAGARNDEDDDGDD
jgi:hypothetical protein